ncbi:MAG TPA: hypothetical protein VGB20_02045 [bacterium]
MIGHWLQPAACRRRTASAERRRVHVDRTSPRLIGAAALAACLCASFAPAASASEKVFSGTGDGTTWHDPQNWFMAGVPGGIDSVMLDKAGIDVMTSADFSAASITVGGKAVSSFTMEMFVYGTITPPQNTDPAIKIRKDGTVVLRGAGTIVLHGSLMNTEEVIPTEPSVLILLE